MLMALFLAACGDDGGDGSAPPPVMLPNASPTISGSPPGTVQVGSSYAFQPSAADADGDELTFSISNKPAWLSFSTSSGALSGSPSQSDVGTYSQITVRVSDGQDTVSLPAFTITVTAAPTSNPGGGNAPPTLSGTPPTQVFAEQAYNFQPSASDPDSNSLTFSIVNRPSWATFNGQTGRLSGTPLISHVGTYSNISIRVSDGTTTVSLAPFSITVSPLPNSTPLISGTPTTSVSAGSAYSFTPTASDPDGDPLTFSVQNKPDWASFNSSTGRLSGTPTNSNAGTYSNIVISVSDGQGGSAQLPAFWITVNGVVTTGSATLSWQPPTENVDGSPLTNLAGYRVVWGTSQNALNQSAQLANPGLTSYVIENLAAGTWYFAVRAYNSDGLESALSNVVSKTIQ